MKRKNQLRIFSGLLWLLLTVSFTISTAAQDYVQQEYESAEQETTRSVAGMNSFKGTMSGDEPLEDLYTATTQLILADMEPKARERAGLFVELYVSYVARAYYSLIIEAKKADKRLLEEYNYLLKDAKNRPDRAEYYKQLAIAKLTYETHWNMLEGLKSWNAISAYGSDDLDLFKQEQIENAYLMFIKGSTDTEIINFLVYRLADLYDFEE